MKRHRLAMVRVHLSACAKPVTMHQTAGLPMVGIRAHLVQTMKSVTASARASVQLAQRMQSQQMKALTVFVRLVTGQKSITCQTRLAPALNARVKIDAWEEMNVLMVMEKEPVALVPQLHIVIIKLEIIALDAQSLG